MQRRETRTIGPRIQNLLWGKAGGRCELCNDPLYVHYLTQKTINTGQKAHIWAFSSRGTRGNLPGCDSEINGIANLILLCYPCHQTVDADKAVKEFTPDYLQSAKEAHESRIERVTGIPPDNKSLVVLYGANIGDANSPLTGFAASRALFASNRYPLSQSPIELGFTGSSQRDYDPAFWHSEESQLTSSYCRELLPRLKRKETEHLSVFAIAPQPLLIRLGSLLTDIPAVDVYQLHREPKTWNWLKHTKGLSPTLKAPRRCLGLPALVLEISGNISDSRVQAAAGPDAAIWRFSVKRPNNDLLRSRKQLQEFRETIRPLLNDIKKRHGDDVSLSIFPAMPVAMSVELGRVRQPKADLNWAIYDQNRSLGGFVRAINIS